MIFLPWGLLDITFLNKIILFANISSPLFYSCVLLFSFFLLHIISPPRSFTLLDDWQMPACCQWPSSSWSWSLTPLPSCHTLSLVYIPFKCTIWGGRWCWEMVGEQHVLRKVTVCCFAVLHLVEVVTPQVPTFQPIAIHLLPHPLPLVHLPLGAASGNLPLPALHQSVQTLLHLYTMAGKASWAHLSYSHQNSCLWMHIWDSNQRDFGTGEKIWILVKMSMI